MSADRYIAAICPKCQMKQKFDKSKVCVEQETYYLGEESASEGTHVWCIVTCQGQDKNGKGCNNMFKIQIDCEGFV